MLRRYSIWIGETERRMESDWSSAIPPASSVGRIGTGAAVTSAITRNTLRR
jgi:hypothetical protein